MRYSRTRPMRLMAITILARIPIRLAFLWTLCLEKCLFWFAFPSHLATHCSADLFHVSLVLFASTRDKSHYERWCVLASAETGSAAVLWSKAH